MASQRWWIATGGGLIVASVSGLALFAGPVDALMGLLEQSAGQEVLVASLVGGVLAGVLAGASVGLPFRIGGSRPRLAVEDLGSVRVLGALYGLLAAGLGVTYLKVQHVLDPGSGFLALLVAPAIGALVAGWIPSTDASESASS